MTAQTGVTSCKLVVLKSFLTNCCLLHEPVSVSGGEDAYHVTLYVIMR